MSETGGEDYHAANALQAATDVSFTVDVQQIVRRAYSEASSAEPFPPGISTARILLNFLYYGKREPNASPEAIAFARLVGHEEIDRLEMRYSQNGPLEDLEALGLAKSSRRFSSESEDLLKRAADLVIPTNPGVEPHHLLAAMAKQPSDACRWLLEEQPKIWDDVAVTIFGYAQASDIPDGGDSEEVQRMSSTNAVSAETQPLSKAGTSADEFVNLLNDETEVELEGKGVAKGSGVDFDEDVGRKFGFSSSRAETVSSAKLFSSLSSEHPLNEDARVFVQWISERGIRWEASGAITSPTLFFCLLAWAEESEHSLRQFGHSITSEHSDALLEVAFENTVPAAPPGGGSAFPMASDDVIEIIRKAQAIATVLSESEIGAEHLMGAVLGHSYPEQNPGDWLDQTFELPAAEILGEFFKYIDGKYGAEILQQWKQLVYPLPFSEPGLESHDEEERVSEDRAISTPGGKIRPKRGAHRDELCLDIDAYASAMAQLLEDAADDDDFVMALYGPWGRGKTTLIERVQERLDPEAYGVVTFSAWKYPTRPEVWIHLYETIAEAAKQIPDEASSDQAREKQERSSKEEKDKQGYRGPTATSPSLFQRLRIGFRLGLLRSGWGPLLLGFALLFLSRLPLLDLISWMKVGLGWSGVLFLAGFLWRATSLGQTVGQRYFSIPDHSERLGMQAVIGKDLSDLLRVWIWPDGEGDTAKTQRQEDLSAINFSCCGHGFWMMVIAVCLGVGTCILVGLRLEPEVEVKKTITFSVDETEISIDPDLDFNQTSTSERELSEVSQAVSGDALRMNESEETMKHFAYRISIGFLGVIALGFIALGFVFAWRPKTKSRLLLVVDDLDRCDPGQMLSLIESLRLFLDNSEMSRRLQIIMLVDQRFLASALLKRADENGVQPPKDSAEKARYVREQREKLFVAELGLPIISEKGLKILAEKLIDREFSESIKRKKEELNEIVNEPEPKAYTYYDRKPKTKREFLQRGPEGPPVDLTEYETVKRRFEESEEEKSERNERQRKAKDELSRLNSEESGAEEIHQPVGLDKDLTFTAEERDLLKSFIQKMHGPHLTPRQVRASVVRYQFARLLAANLGQKPDPEGLLNAITEGLSGKAKGEVSASVLELVAAAVVCREIDYFGENQYDHSGGESKEED